MLKQRNALLKSSYNARRSGGDLATLDVWDAHLARAGAELLAGRIELVDAIRPRVDKSYDSIADSGGPAIIDYKCSLGP